MPESIDPEIARLFPSVKSGVVERGLWKIPLYFDKGFGRNRGCIRLRRYLVHMAEMGATKEAMMDKTMEIYNEFSELIDNFIFLQRTVPHQPQPRWLLRLHSI